MDFVDLERGGYARYRGDLQPRRAMDRQRSASALDEHIAMHPVILQKYRSILMCIELIEDDGVLYAEYLPANTEYDRQAFFSDRSAGFQFGVTVWPSGHRELAHYHKKMDVGVVSCSEFIFLQSGRMTITFYTRGGREVTKVNLSKGDAIVLVDGAHSLFIDEHVQAIMIKQGPFVDNLEKVMVDIA